MRRITVTLAAALLAALLSSGVATAAPSENAGTTFTYRESIAFTLPAGTCPDLPPDLSLEFTGTLIGHFHLSVDANGVIHVNWPDTAFGTAVDSDGARYAWNYANVTTVTDGGFPVVIQATDHFTLVGNGAANQLHVGFVDRFLVTEDGIEEVFFGYRGDPWNCDPI